MKSRALKHDDQLIPYQIEHKPAVTRRIHLRTAPDGSLLVIAPRRASIRSIHNTLQERVHEVVRFLVNAREKLRETPQLKYVHGEQHLFMGDHRRLEIVRSGACAGTVEMTSRGIRIRTAEAGSDRIKSLLEAWYRQQAAAHFSERMDLYAEKAHWVKGARPPIRLRRMKRTWGSCSARGNITLNTQLMKVPPQCIDYVIAHELCHLREMNHGKAFYALQEKLYPGWRAARSHLRKMAHVYLTD